MLTNDRLDLLALMLIQEHGLLLHTVATPVFEQRLWLLLTGLRFAPSASVAGKPCAVGGKGNKERDGFGSDRIRERQGASRRFLCCAIGFTGGSRGRSFRKPSDHLQDAVGDDLQFSVDLGELTRGLEDVEVPVERDLVADFGLLVVDPRIWCMR